MYHFFPSFQHDSKGGEVEPGQGETDPENLLRLAGNTALIPQLPFLPDSPVS